MSFEETIEAVLRKVVREELEAQGPASSARRELLTYAEAAELVGVGESTVKGWVKSGELPVYGHNSIRRVKPAEVVAVLKRLDAKKAAEEDPENVTSILATLPGRRAR